MKTFIALTLWCLLLVTCWPLALALLFLLPFIWLVLLPFAIVGLTFGLVVKVVGAIILIPFKVMRAL